MTGRVEQFLVSGMWAHKDRHSSDESDQMLVLELRVEELEF